jgi:diacylglycerol kinase family enzyme
MKASFGSQKEHALLVNPNARGITPEVVARLHDMVSPDNIYCTRDNAEARHSIREILSQGYETVFMGGGDGTVHTFINGVRGALPRLGVLPLGTANVLAEMVSSGNPILDLENYVANPCGDSYALGLCESEGESFAFGGLGLDAALVPNSGPDLATASRRLLRNAGGVVTAALMMSAPQRVGRWVQGRAARLRVTNMGDSAYSVLTSLDGAGQRERTYLPGEVMFQGPIRAALFGTCPFVGQGMKLLPYAGIDTDRFHLRIAPVLSDPPLTHLRAAWKGGLDPSQVVDFQASAIRLELSESMPLHLGGEALGMRDEVLVQRSDRAVELVRFI